MIEGSVFCFVWEDGILVKQSPQSQTDGKKQTFWLSAYSVTLTSQSCCFQLERTTGGKKTKKKTDNKLQKRNINYVN